MHNMSLTPCSTKYTNKDLAIQYLNKAKSQKKTATILGATGLAAFTAGLIVNLSGFAQGWNSSESVHVEIIDDRAYYIDGIRRHRSIVTAIPFSIASKRNEKQGKLLLGVTTTMIAPGTPKENTLYPKRPESELFDGKFKFSSCHRLHG